MQYVYIALIAAASIGIIFAFNFQNASAIQNITKDPAVKLNSTIFSNARYKAVGVVLCNSPMSDCIVAPFTSK